MSLCTCKDCLIPGRRKPCLISGHDSIRQWWNAKFSTLGIAGQQDGTKDSNLVYEIVYAPLYLHELFFVVTLIYIMH